MTIRILVAEDEENIRLALKIIVSKNIPCDEVVACEHGQTAWEKLQAEPFSMVISDWNMPHMTGFQLLEAMRQNDSTKHIPMLLLTARSDKTSVINALQAGVNDYVTKPFTKDALVQKAKKMLAKAHAELLAQQNALTPGSATTLSISEEIVNRIRSGHVSLPVLPELAHRIEELFQRIDVDIDELVQVVQTDPGITSKLISISNSPQYCGLSEIKSLDKAIARIGLKMTENYVLILSKRGLFKVDVPQYEKLLSQVWQHSLATAACAQALAQKLALPDPDSFYTLGLLHDVGKLILLQFFAEASKKRPDATEQECLDLMEKFHGEFGAALLATWKFSGEQQQIARFHDTVASAGKPSNTLYLIALANLLAIKAGYQVNDHAVSDEDIASMAQHLCVGASMIGAVIQQMKEYMAAQGLV